MYYTSNCLLISGVFKLTGGEFDASLEVMPLIGGFLPLPSVKLHKYQTLPGKFQLLKILLNVARVASRILELGRKPTHSWPGSLFTLMLPLMGLQAMLNDRVLERSLYILYLYYDFPIYN